jgi:nucleoside-diphosphate kinase
MIQRSLVLLKPDAVQRGVMGDILSRFERAGLKVVGAKLIKADKDTAEKHYKKDKEWQKKVGNIQISDCEKFGLNAEEIFGTEDPAEIGEIVNGWLYGLFDEGPVFAFVFQGPGAVDKIRALVGSTFPDTAPPGTIRGDYGLDSSFSSLKRKRAVFNLIHASGTAEEAEEEIGIWFTEEEILEYKRADEDVYRY